MARLILTSVFFLFCVYGFSQQEDIAAPEYEKMRIQVFDNTSPFFYPNLFSRYNAGDTTLTLTEFRYLYYGYSFQSRYTPNQQSRYHNKMMVYLRKGSLTEKELNEFIKLAELNLKDLPFDIRTLDILAYSYKQKNDSLAYQITAFKKNMILQAIESSGDGLTDKTAYHVIYLEHEKDMLREKNLEIAGINSMAVGLCDYVLVQANEKNIRGLYFNVGRMLNVKTERNP